MTELIRWTITAALSAALALFIVKWISDARKRRLR